MTQKKLRLPPLAKNLSARLLVLTIGFVMLAEVLIYAPSIGRFRLVYLEERLAAGHLAILALEATPDYMVSADLERELLAHVGAISVALTKPGVGKLMLMVETPKRVSATYDLRDAGFMDLIGDAFVALASDGGRLLRVVGWSPKNPAMAVEVVLEEAPMRAAMIGFSERILALSLVISLITAALVYLSLHWMMVRPMRRITDSMMAFRQDPEDASLIIGPSERSDEIGMAQRELANMQQGLRAALHQKTHLAALGTAVTKINHDMKNILATAQLLSDRLVDSEDPQVRRIAPAMVGAIDRAVKLCASTLDFTREGPPRLELSRFDLCELVDDVGRSLPETAGDKADWHNGLDPGLSIEADRDQLFRVFANVGRNAFQAGAHRIEVSAWRDGDHLMVDVADDGPGIAPRAREKLFQPFTGTARAGGAGLGLAIARDLMRAHGGDILLVRSSEQGACFRLVLPVNQPDRQTARAGLTREDDVRTTRF